MSDIIKIDRSTRMNRRIDSAIWVDRRVAYINGTRKHAMSFVAEWLDGATLTSLAVKHGLSFELAENVIRWWQREQFRKGEAKLKRVRAQLRLADDSNAGEGG